MKATSVRLAVGIASVLAVAHAASARDPTVSDFAICNQEATGTVGGSASPRDEGAPRGERAPRGESPRGEGPPRAEGGPRRETAPPAQTPESRERGRSAEHTDPTGSMIVSPDDPLLHGMAAAHADDPAYRSGYRRCMEGRGVTTGGVLPAR